MSINRVVRLIIVLAVCASCLAWLAAAAGCGSKQTSASTTPGQVQTNATTAPKDVAKTDKPPATTPKKPDNPPATKPDTSDSDAAVSAAKASARANNPSIGALDVLGVKVIDPWARVDLQPSDKSTDGASWLLKKNNGTWTVVDFGTSIVPEDFPEAPAGLFQ
jgi:hypothetical protein